MVSLTLPSKLWFCYRTKLPILCSNYYLPHIFYYFSFYIVLFLLAFDKRPTILLLNIYNLRHIYPKCVKSRCILYLCICIFGINSWTIYLSEIVNSHISVHRKEKKYSKSFYDIYINFVSPITTLSKMSTILIKFYFNEQIRYLLLFSCSLWPHGLHHARLPCLSLSPGVSSNSCPLGLPWWLRW